MLNVTKLFRIIIRKQQIEQLRGSRKRIWPWLIWRIVEYGYKNNRTGYRVVEYIVNKNATKKYNLRWSRHSCIPLSTQLTTEIWNSEVIQQMNSDKTNLNRFQFPSQTIERQESMRFILHSLRTGFLSINRSVIHTYSVPVVLSRPAAARATNLCYRKAWYYCNVL